MSAQFTPSEWKVICRALRNGTEDGSLLEIASVESIEATILKALAVERRGTQPDPRSALLDEAVKALRFYGDEENWDDDGSCVKRDAAKIDHTTDFHDVLDLGRTARSVLARIDALEKGVKDGTQE